MLIPRAYMMRFVSIKLHYRNEAGPGRLSDRTLVVMERNNHERQRGDCFCRLTYWLVLVWTNTVNGATGIVYLKWNDRRILHRRTASGVMNCSSNSLGSCIVDCVVL